MEHGLQFDVDPKRSANMRAVGQKNTSPELKVRSLAHRLGFRFRLHRKDLPGTPDLVFPKLKLCLFVHGCFWHRHTGCKRASTPITRREYWLDKFRKNKARDRRNRRELARLGWRSDVIWECETKDEVKLATRLKAILSN